MKKNTYKYLVSFVFLFVFATKMGLSIAPLILSIDKNTVSAVIMQLELENQGKEVPDAAKDLTKWLKKGSELFSSQDFTLVSFAIGIKLKYYNRFRDYINSYYPSVLTPPPNKILA